MVTESRIINAHCAQTDAAVAFELMTIIITHAERGREWTRDQILDLYTECLKRVINGQKKDIN